MLQQYAIAQTATPQKNNATMPLAGKYQYGNPQKDGGGTIYIYAESDSTILFSLVLIAEPPSDHIGEIYGRVKIKKESGLFISQMEDAEESCKFSLKFTKDKLVIETIDGQYNCGFGQAVYADGTYKRLSTTNSPYFVNSAGKKEYFKDLKF
jgi:hypothetical protein